MEPDTTIAASPQADIATGKNFTRIPLAEFITEMQDEALASHLSAMQDQLGRVEALLEKQAAPETDAGETAQPTDRLESDKALDIKQLASYMGVSVNWIHKHSHELPRMQSGKRGRLRFRRSEIDSYLKKHSTPGIPD